MSLFVALKSPDCGPSSPLSTEHTRLCSISPSPLVLLLLSEQLNEAEGQRRARAILPYYARIHLLSHKQWAEHPGKQNKTTLSACLCQVFMDAVYTTGGKKDP